MWLYNTTGFFGIAVLSAIFPWIVMTGMHTALAPYLVNAMVPSATTPSSARPTSLPISTRVPRALP